MDFGRGDGVPPWTVGRRRGRRPHPVRGAFLHTGCTQVPFARRRWTLKWPTPPIVASLPCRHRW